MEPVKEHAGPASGAEPVMVQVTSLDVFRTRMGVCPLCGEATTLIILCGVTACHRCTAILVAILESYVCVNMS